MSSERPIGKNQAMVYNNAPVAPNDQILLKVMTAPVIYVRQNPKCSLCPQTYTIYINSAVIADLNFDILKDPLFNAVDEACCLCCSGCSTLNFYSPLDLSTIHYNITLPTCCEQCCKDCCKKKACCDCVDYGVPLNGSYGASADMRFGYYARRIACCSCCSFCWEFFGRMGESRFMVELSCCQANNPCAHLYPLKFFIKKGEAEIGTVIRNPRGCCGTFTYEIQFPSEFTLEDRLLLIAFCCKRE